MKALSKKNEPEKAEGHSVINAVKVSDKNYPLKVHCNTLEKHDPPIFRHKRWQAKPSGKDEILLYNTQIYLLLLPMWPISLAQNFV